MKRILTTPFAWHLVMLAIGVLAAPSSALGWSILATASPFRLRVRHLIAILAVVLLLSLIPMLLTCTINTFTEPQGFFVCSPEVT